MSPEPLVTNEIHSDLTDGPTHTATSTDWETLESSTDGDCSSIDEIHTAVMKQFFSVAETVRASSTGKENSIQSRPGFVKPTGDGSDDQSSGYYQQRTGYRRGSYTLRNREGLNVCSSNAHPRRRFDHTTLEAFATQERLQIEDGPPALLRDASPVPGMRKCSAEVTFAFPGIYHALLEQWISEPSNSPASNAENVRIISSDEMLNTSNSSYNAHETARMCSSASNCEESVPATIDCNSHDQQPATTSIEPNLTFGRCNPGIYHEMIPQSTGGLPPTTDETGCIPGGGRPEIACVDEDRPYENRHSFGLHIGLNGVSFTSNGTRIA